MAIRLFLLLSSFLFCQINAESCGDEGGDQCPFFGWAQYDYIGKADFKCDKAHHEHLKYQTGRINFGSVILYNEDCKEGLAAMLAYTAEKLDWKENPSFSQKDFKTVSLVLSGFTERLGDWKLKGFAMINQNADHITDWQKYSNWDLMFWARYSLCKNIGLHTGFYAITGMHLDRVYPILGIDWRCRKDLVINAVFPVDMNIIWECSKKWTLSGTIHFYESRQRAGSDEILPRAVWEVTAWGGEIGAKYLFTDMFSAGLHLGYSFGGKLKIADHKYLNSDRYKFGAAPYIGGEIRASY